MIKNINEMKYLINYLYHHDYNPLFFLTPDYGLIILDNGYRIFIHKETQPYMKTTLYTVNVYDYYGKPAYDELCGICEDNHIPCKDESEIITMVDVIRNLNRNNLTV